MCIRWKQLKFCFKSPFCLEVFMFYTKLHFLRMIYVTLFLVVVNHNLLNFSHYNLCHFVRARQNYFLVLFQKYVLWDYGKLFLFFSYLSLFLTTWAKLFKVTLHSHSRETTYHLFNTLRTLHPYQYFARSLS